MPRPTSRLLLSALALVALAVLSSTHATALPHAAAVRPAAGPQETAPGLFARVWDLFSVWTIGSGLDPNGAGTNAGPGADPDAAGSGDTGSVLEPNG